jgi:hypothetical protein
MKNKMLLGTVLVGMLSMGQAFSATSLTNAQIAATYNGDSGAIYGSDFLLGNSAIQNITKLDLLDPEFITADSLFQIDFSTTGLVTFTFDHAANVPLSTFTFDFGTSLGSNVIASFTAADVSGVTAGSPILSVLNGHTITADLGSVTGDSTLYSFTAQIAAVPEPMTPAMLIAGLGTLGLIARKRKQA